MKRIAICLFNRTIVLFALIALISFSSFGYSEAETDDTDSSPNPIFSSDHITISGAIEIEAYYEDWNYDDPSEPDNSTSDIFLATFELGFDIAFHELISGYALLSYEEDEDVEIDEGYIRIDSTSDYSFYLIAGRHYLPFCNFESDFISDSLTLEIGETRKEAILIGTEINGLNLSVGFFNGDVDKENKEDDHIINYVLSANFSFSNDTINEFAVGVSNMNNIAESDALSEEINTTEGTVKDLVGGYAASILVGFERIHFSSEYVWATGTFQPEELAFDSGKAYKPRAFNTEISFSMTDNLSMAVRYGFSDNSEDFLPEKVYGGIVNFDLFENTSLGIEYQSFEYENENNAVSMVAQLALSF